jgi:hypothetical protein
MTTIASPYSPRLLSQMCDRMVYYIMDLGQIVKDTQGEGVDNILKEEWEHNLRKILVKVGIKLWEREDYIRRFYKNYVKGFLSQP